MLEISHYFKEKRIFANELIKKDMQMNQDVTLHINSHVLEEATNYARTKGINLSGLVESLLRKVTGEKQGNRMLPVDKLDARVRNLLGAARVENQDVGLDGEVCRDKCLEEE